MADAVLISPDRKTPAIRTMRSDIDELLKTGKPSLVQFIGQGPSPAPAAIPTRRKKARLIAAILTAAAIAAAVAASALFLYGGFGRASPTTERPAETLQRRLAPPPPYFATETSRTITASRRDRGQFLRLVEDALKEREREGTITRLAIRLADGPADRFAAPADLFELLRLAPPAGLVQQLDPNIMVFVYHGSSGNRMGWAGRTRDPERTFADMLAWEPALLSALSPLFFDEPIEPVVAPFEDRTYRNIDWRYLKLSPDKDLGIGYAVFPANSVFILTTGKEMTETVINRLFDAR